MERADKVLSELGAATSWLEARADDWLGTMRDLHVFAYRCDQVAEHPIVDLELLSTYRAMFDRLAEFAMLVDPFALDLRDQNTL